MCPRVFSISHARVHQDNRLKNKVLDFELSGFSSCSIMYQEILCKIFCESKLIQRCHTGHDFVTVLNKWTFFGSNDNTSTFICSDI